MFSPNLTPPELEFQFRQDARLRDVAYIIVSLLLALIPVSGFFINDVYSFADISLFTEILSARIAITLYTVFIIIMLKKSKSIILVDRLLLIWMMLVALLTLLISYSRPEDYIVVTVLNILYVFALYVMFPLPIYIPGTAGLLISLGESVMILTIKDYPVIPGGLIMLIVSFVIANIFGIIASYRWQKARRQQFILLRSEREVKENLQVALSEVKTLRGIIPICSTCRKIRNDEGYYEVVEQYLKRHSEADFSHTLCPDCLALQMRELTETDLKE